ncbi:MAG: RES family NAD+ phosphorylase [Bergeyella sp.]
MLLFRITKKEFSQNLFASGNMGRWNVFGQKVIYTSESVCLAMLENMIRIKGVGFEDKFQTMVIYVPDNSGVSAVNHKDLPDEWRKTQNYGATQEIGKEWFLENKNLLLKVPSAILPISSNYVINTFHKDFKNVKLIDVLDFVPDERLEKILIK